MFLGRDDAGRFALASYVLPNAGIAADRPMDEFRVPLKGDAAPFVLAFSVTCFCVWSPVRCKSACAGCCWCALCLRAVLHLLSLRTQLHVLTML